MGVLLGRRRARATENLGAHVVKLVWWGKRQEIRRKAGKGEYHVVFQSTIECILLRAAGEIGMMVFSHFVPFQITY